MSAIRPFAVSDPAPCRVVVTGLGVVSPIGNSAESFWESLAGGRCGIRTASVLCHDDGTPACAGEAADFHGEIDDFPPLPDDVRKKLRKALKAMNRETQMSVAATWQALVDGRLAEAQYDPERVGVSFGAGYVSLLPQDFAGGLEACRDDARQFDIERWGMSGIPHVAPLWLLTCLPNMPACQAAICADLRGPNNTVTLGEAAANVALAEAAHWIREGDADAVLVGGVGNNLLPYSWLHNVLESDVAPHGADPAHVCRPFDRRRSGAVVAEGAAAFLLEDYDAAVRRGAPIYGEIVAGGSSCVVDRQHSAHGGRALANAMRAALRSARSAPAEIGHLHAHGLSSLPLDKEESRAIVEVFGPRAASVPLVAGKSYFGNAGAGSAALELAASLLALKHGRLFRVLNYEEPDPECPVAPVVSDDVPAGESFLNLSLAPHGQASCLLVRSAA